MPCRGLQRHLDHEVTASMHYVLIDYESIQPTDLKALAEEAVAAALLALRHCGLEQ